MKPRVGFSMSLPVSSSKWLMTSNLWSISMEGREGLREFGHSTDSAMIVTRESYETRNKGREEEELCAYTLQ